MHLHETLCLLLFVGVAFGWGGNLQVFQENFTVDYVDKKYTDFALEVFKVNETTNAIRVDLTLKFDIPKNLKFAAVVKKFVNNGYKLTVLQMEDAIREFTSTEAFGVADLCLRCTKPPATWPFKKGVRYHCDGWTPDPAKFPPNFLEGRWKVMANLYFRNKTRIIGANWFIHTFYK